MNLYENIKSNYNKPKRTHLTESNKENFSLKESNPAKYLGISFNETETLTEKVNHANDDINRKIREALRSKTAARKYADEFKSLGITIDDDQREGVSLIGPNGRRLSADRKTIYGPTKPGFGKTHDNTSGYGESIGSKRRDIKDYKKRANEWTAKKEELEGLDRDDIIRKYPDKSTEDALARHKEDIDRMDSYITGEKRDIRNAENAIRRIRKNRETKHNSDLYWRDTETDKDSPNVDKIDYKGYLDSKDNNENKDFDGEDYYNRGHYKRTPGQKARGELKDLKNDVQGTNYASEARRIVRDQKIDDKILDARKKELEEEYKRKVAEEVDSLKDAKRTADEDYAKSKERYEEKNNKLNDFRKAHNLRAKKPASYDSYLEKRAKDSY